MFSGIGQYISELVKKVLAKFTWSRTPNASISNVSWVAAIDHVIIIWYSRRGGFSTPCIHSPSLWAEVLFYSNWYQPSYLCTWKAGHIEKVFIFASSLWQQSGSVITLLVRSRGIEMILESSKHFNFPGTNPQKTYIALYRIMVLFWILFGLAYTFIAINLIVDIFTTTCTISHCDLIIHFINGFRNCS